MRPEGRIPRIGKLGIEISQVSVELNDALERKVV